MKAKDIIIIGAVGAALYGIHYITKPIPLTADELSKIKFDPMTMTTDHPFFYTWFGVGKNYESFSALMTQFRKSCHVMLNKRMKVEELNEAEKNMLRIASIEEAIDRTISENPELFMESLGLEFEFDTDDNGCAIFTDPFSQTPNKNLTQEERERRAAIAKSIQKNKMLRRKAKREITKNIMTSILYTSECAEVVAKILTNNLATPDDMSDKELNAVLKNLHPMISKNLNIVIKETIKTL